SQSRSFSKPALRHNSREASRGASRFFYAKGKYVAEENVKVGSAIFPNNRCGHRRRRARLVHRCIAAVRFFVRTSERTLRSANSAERGTTGLCAPRNPSTEDLV